MSRKSIMVYSKYRGHNIIEINGVYIYEDTKQIVSENINRPCGHCGKNNTKEGHDNCLGVLAGVQNACCGHGNKLEAYIQFLDGRHIKGQKALDYQKKDL